MDEAKFRRLAGEVLARLDRIFGDFDPDEVEASLADTVLTLSFADGMKFVVNSQSAARQIWVAAVASGMHFSYDEGKGRWLDDKTGEELFTCLERVVGGKLGRKVKL